MLIIKGILRVIIQMLFFGAILFLPIGTWAWPRALWFLLIFGVISLATHLALARWAPASLEARVSKEARGSQIRADGIVSFFIGVFHIAWFIAIPNDVFRWHLLPEPSTWVAGLGLAACLLGYGIMVTALWQNSFAIPVVGDQAQRGQVLVDTGLYGLVRHPMYAGHIFFLLGLPLWLGSWAGALAAPVVFLPLIPRILVEERALRKTLAGYPEYTERVRYCLLPRVW
jgi:protein-S-isoprenylcysteine O-methyltransferase Ste14